MKAKAPCKICGTQKNVYLWKKAFDNTIYRLCEKCVKNQNNKQLNLFNIWK